MGFTKTHTLACSFDPSTSKVKHACAVRFDEDHATIPSSELLFPGSILLTAMDDAILNLPEVHVDITSTPHLGSIPLSQWFFPSWVFHWAVQLTMIHIIISHLSFNLQEGHLYLNF